MTPHQTDLLQGLDLAEVEDGLGGEGAGEAAGDVDLPQCPPLRLAVNQIRESVVTELLLRERLRSEADMSSKLLCTNWICCTNSMQGCDDGV